MLYLSCRVKRHAHSSNSPRIIEWRGFSKNDGQSSPAVRLPIPSCDSKTRLERSTPNPSWDLCWKYLGIPPSLVQTEYQMLVSVEMVGAFLSTSCMHIWYPLVAPRGGPAPEIVDPSGCFPEGPDPPIPILSISEWIKSRVPSLAFVNQTFLLTLNLDKGTNTLEQFGRSKMVKGQAPQNILGMLWIFWTYIFYLWILWNMDLLDFSHSSFSPCMPQISWPLWKVLNRDKVDKHVTTNFPRKQFLHTFNASCF